MQGYGLTECVGPVSLTVPGDPHPDQVMCSHVYLHIYNIYISTLWQVGPPLPCNNVKLVDIPDMEYWASRGQGEVCVMGANVFQGYFRSVSIGIGVAGWGRGCSFIRYIYM